MRDKLYTLKMHSIEKTGVVDETKLDIKSILRGESMKMVDDYDKSPHEEFCVLLDDDGNFCGVNLGDFRYAPFSCSSYCVGRIKDDGKSIAMIYFSSSGIKNAEREPDISDNPSSDYLSRVSTSEKRFGLWSSRSLRNKEVRNSSEPKVRESPVYDFPVYDFLDCHAGIGTLNHDSESKFRVFLEKISDKEMLEDICDEYDECREGFEKCEDDCCEHNAQCASCRRKFKACSSDCENCNLSECDECNCSDCTNYISKEEFIDNAVRDTIKNIVAAFEEISQYKFVSGILDKLDEECRK